MKKISVKSLDDLDIVLRVVRSQFEEHGARTVVIKKLTASVKEEQRGLYWRFLSVIAGDIGNTKEEQHRIYKELFLLNIYLHDPENHPEFVELVDNMRLIRDQAPEQYKVVREFVIDNVSHMDATVTNMRDYLIEIENHARGLQIMLPANTREGVA